MFGYDFMIDDKFGVWLIEVNSSPAMDYSTVNNDLFNVKKACY
jgi:D-alanine-D-alanine ligase-like ATP-grasp enzyme